MEGLGISIDGRDISLDICVHRAVIDLALSDFADSATLVFQDAEQRWGDWAPEAGLPIALSWGDQKLFGGLIDNAAASNGFFSLEVSSAAARKPFRFSHTCRGTLRNALTAIADALGLAPKFTGDFSASIKGAWLEEMTAGEMLRALRRFFLFDFVADPERIRFISQDAERELSPTFRWAEGPNGDFGFSAPPAPHGCAVTNGAATETAGDGADRVIAFGFPSACLAAIAQARTAEAARARAALKINADTIWIPGAAADIDSIAEDFRGAWLIRSTRIDVAAWTQSVKLAKL